MIKTIKKRNGDVVTFNTSKISDAIRKAFNETNEGSYSDSIKVTNFVVAKLESSKVEIPTVEQIQDEVERALMTFGFDNTAKVYILYRNERNKIRQEQKRIMQNINILVNSDSNDSDVKRENSNIDGNTPMGTMLQMGSLVSKEFSKGYLMNPKFANAHNNGDIHIHDMDFEAMGTLTCLQIDLGDIFKRGFNTGHGTLRTPGSISSASSLAAVAIQANQNEMHGGQAIPLFDFYLAPYVEKSYFKHFKELLAYSFSDKTDIAEDEIDGIISKFFEKVSFLPNLENDEEDLNMEYAEILSDLSYEDEDTMLCVIERVRERALKKTDRETYQAMEAFVHNMNTLHSRAGAQVPFSSVNFGMDTSISGRMVSKNLMLAQEAGLGHGETPIFPILIFQVKEGINFNPEDPNYDLFQLSIRVTSKRLFPNWVFVDAPFNLKGYNPEDPNTIIATMGCRTRVYDNLFGKSQSVKRGNISFTSINLPRLGIEHGKYGIHHNLDMNAFYADLDDKLQLCVDQLIERYKIQCSKKIKNFPFLMGQGLWMDSENLNPNDTLEKVVKHGTLSVGFIGLAECLKALIGKHQGESDEAQKLGLEIIQHMRDFMDNATQKYQLNFSLLATPAEGLCGRFVKMDAKKYGILPEINDRKYYTNSSHVPVYYDLSAYKKLQIEAPYHAMENAGHIAYVELDGDTTQNLEAVESIVRCMKELGIGYGAINHPVDRDPVCGYEGVIYDECPHCHRKEFEGENHEGFFRIRRNTGYLVGTTERFNDAKRAEEHDRVKHGLK